MGRCCINPLFRLRYSLPLPGAARYARIVVVAASALLLSIYLVGCSRPPLFERSIQAMRNVDSFDFVEESSKNSGGFGGSYYRITGTYQSPNKLSKQIISGLTDTFGSPFFKPNRYGHSRRPVLGNTRVLRTISIEDEIYVARSTSGNWAPDHEGRRDYGTGRSDTPWVNPVDRLVDVISGAPRYRSKGVEVLDCVKVRHLTWRTHLRESRLETYRQVDVFIGIEDSLVRKLFIGSSWTEVPCNTLLCTDEGFSPGSFEYTLEFSFPGDETPIVAPTV